MTEKQEQILNAALKLFAEEGFKSTSTSKVAKEAGVSEGLIFRHYVNKEGLLQAIMKEGEEKAKLLFADIVMEADPKKTLEKTLEMGVAMQKDPSAANFWKLQYKIKWELEEYGAHKMLPLLQALTRAFAALKYEEPEKEAELMIVCIDGLATRFYLDKQYDMTASIEYLKKKYKV